jgi:hypothetical protein
VKEACPPVARGRYARAPMRLSTWSCCLSIALGACSFSPGGGAASDDDGDDDVTADARGDGGDLVDAAVDAPAVFDPNACPSEYLVLNNQTSRYRMISDVTWAGAEAACKAQSNGLTHLAVFGGMPERDAIGAVLFFSGDFRRTWIGAWNDGTGLRTVTGEPPYPAMDVAPSQAVTWIRDLVSPFRADPVTVPYAALCECDGQPATP